MMGHGGGHCHYPTSWGTRSCGQDWGVKSMRDKITGGSRSWVDVRGKCSGGQGCEGSCSGCKAQGSGVSFSGGGWVDVN